MIEHEVVVVIKNREFNRIGRSKYAAIKHVRMFLNELSFSIACVGETRANITRNLLEVFDTNRPIDEKVGWLVYRRSACEC